MPVSLRLGGGVTVKNGTAPAERISATWPRGRPGKLLRRHPGRECAAGSVCAQVCIECVGEDGTTCGPPKCEDLWFNDFVDCANDRMCDGSAIPSGTVPGWGNFENLCKNEVCAQIKSECNWLKPTCCFEYWGVLNTGGTPRPEAEICKTISRQSDCCEMPVSVGDWDKIYCNTSGKVVNAHNRIDNKWYCGFGGSAWDHVCAQVKGCGSTYVPEGAGGIGSTCPTFPGMDAPWKPTYPNPAPSGGMGWTPNPGSGGPKISIKGDGPDRVPSTRGGGTRGSMGGRE